MRSYFFAFKIALVFTLLLSLVLLGAFRLFLDVAGDDLIREFGRLRVFEGVDVAEKIEHLVAQGAPRSYALKEAQKEGRERQWMMSVRALEEGPPSGQVTRRLHRQPRRDDIMRIKGRVCYLTGPPGFQAWIPLMDEGETRAWLVVEGSLHARGIHAAIHSGFQRIGLLALLAAFALSVYLTAPLRRMSRSMDRIAAGELEHRVAVDGRDEVARGGRDEVARGGRDEVAMMARSFNAMADRISGMITGQKELMAGVSHELRSPLARMKVGLALMREADGFEKRVADLEEEVDVLDSLVGELLLASRFDLGAVPLNPEALPWPAMAQQAWERVQAAAEECGMSLEIDSKAPHLQLLADRSLVLRILGNLFENAVRYAAQGTVKVSARRRGERIEITVLDQGPGVKESALERLFEPFYRVDSSRSHGGGAVGLGLMVVRRAVEAHQGKVRAEKGPEGGLAIIFDLSLAEGGTAWS